MYEIADGHVLYSETMYNKTDLMITPPSSRVTYMSDEENKQQKRRYGNWKGLTYDRMQKTTC